MTRAALRPSNYAMDFFPITSSSHVTGVAHDGADLYVRYNTGKVFKYTGVPASLFTQLKDAASVGSFLHAKIRGRYPHLEHRGS